MDIDDLRKKAEAGDAQAQFDLAHCYHEGKGVPQDYSEAVKWGRKAAEQGHAQAQCRLAAEQGDIDAQFQLGLDHYSATVGPSWHDKEAVKWLQLAADKNHSGSQYYLGMCYFDGEGVDRDYKKAIELYRKSAMASEPMAHLKLAECYMLGLGVKQDRIEAFAWLSVAAAERWNPADEELSKLIPKMSASELEEGKALAEQYIPKFRCHYDR